MYFSISCKQITPFKFKAYTANIFPVLSTVFPCRVSVHPQTPCFSNHSPCIQLNPVTHSLARSIPVSFTASSMLLQQAYRQLPLQFLPCVNNSFLPVDSKKVPLCQPVPPCHPNCLFPAHKKAISCTFESKVGKTNELLIFLIVKYCQFLALRKMHW